MVVSIITLAVMVYLGVLLVRALLRRGWSSRRIWLTVGGLAVLVAAVSSVVWIPASHGGSSGGTSGYHRTGPP